MKNWLALLFAVMMCMFAGVGLAADLTISGGNPGDHYTYENGVLTIISEVEISVTQYSSVEKSTERIVIDPGAGKTAKVKFKNLHLDPEAAYAPTVDLRSGTAEVTIVGDNTFDPPIYVNYGALSGSDWASFRVDEDAHLILKGDGTLTVNGNGMAAAMGGDSGDGHGAITFESGTYLITQAGNRGAALGCGCGGSGTDGVITINGGTVTAQTNGTWGGAAVGGAWQGEQGGVNQSRAGTVIVNGGELNVRSGSTGQDSGYIGGGGGLDEYKRFVGTLLIYGGVVNGGHVFMNTTVEGGTLNMEKGKEIVVRGGTVTSTGDGIERLTVYDGTVNVNATDDNIGIGDGDFCLLRMYGGTVSVTSRSVGIGGTAYGDDDASGAIHFYGGDLSVNTTNANHAAIGANYDSHGIKLNVYPNASEQVIVEYGATADNRASKTVASDTTYTGTDLLKKEYKSWHIYTQELSTHVHGVCGEAGCTETGHGDITWTAWTSTTELPTAAGNYYLTADVTLNGTHSFPDGREISLCLNGHTIKQTRSETAITVKETLNLTDCRINAGGKITRSSDTNGAGVGVLDDAVLNMYGGSIEGHRIAYVSNGMGVYVNGAMNMYGGRIANNNQGMTQTSAYGGGVSVDSSTAVFNMYGGEISSNRAMRGGGLHVRGAANLYGGTIANNAAIGSESSSFGGGIYVQLDGRLTMAAQEVDKGSYSYYTTCKLSQNVNMETGTVSNIYLGTTNSNEQVLMMITPEFAESGNGATFETERSPRSGEPVRFLRKSDGTMVTPTQASRFIPEKSGYQTAVDEDGYGVLQLKRNTVTLNTNGGTIADDKKVTFYEEGVGAVLPGANDITRTNYRFDGWYASSSFSGSPVTEIPSTATGNRTYYAKWTQTYAITVTGGTASVNGTNVTSAAAGDTVTITANTPETGKEFASWSGTSGLTFDNAASAETTFVMPAKAVSISVTWREQHKHRICGLSAEACAAAGHNGHDEVVFAPWDGTQSVLNKLEQKKQYYFYLTQDVEGSITIPNTTKVALCLNGHNITGTKDDRTVSVHYSARLDLCNCKSDGGMITHAANEAGGGVSVSNASMWMWGGEISGNSAVDGAGVSVSSSNGGFVLYGGKIANNTASEYGGGIAAGFGASITIRGGEISGNAAAKGGAISVSIPIFGDDDRLYLYGGTIKDNTASTAGGAIYMNGDYARVIDAPEMSGNTANGKASAVYLETGKVLTRYGSAALTNSLSISTQTAPTADTPVPFMTYTSISADKKESVIASDLQKIVSEQGYAIRRNATTDTTLEFYLPMYSVTVTGGTANTTTAAKGTSVTLTAQPGEGERFTGWTLTGVDTTGLDLTQSELTFTMPAGDVTAAAGYEAIAYSIDYDLKGGSLPAGKTNPAGYTVETETFVLIEPELEGNTFIGWTGSNGTTPQKNVGVAKGSMGDLTFTANWDLQKFTVLWLNHD